MADVNEKIGVADVLGNCAGITVAKHMIDLTLEEWERVIGVNLRGIWCLSQLFAKQLRESDKKKGNIVSISSQASKISERRLFHLQGGYQPPDAGTWLGICGIWYFGFGDLSGLRQCRNGAGGFSETFFGRGQDAR